MESSKPIELFPEVLCFIENEHGICSILDDADKFKTLLGEKTIFNRLVLLGADRPLQLAVGSDRFKRFSELIKVIGKNVKVLDVRRAHLHPELIKLLALMPHLELIKLMGVETQASNEDFKIELNELKEIELQANDSFATAMLLKGLSATSIEKVTVTSNLANQTSTKPFANLQKVNLLIVNEFSANYFNFASLKVDSLEVLGPAPLDQLLKGQDELKSLKVNVRNGEVEAIISNVKNLRELTMLSAENEPTENDFKGLQKMKNLNKLEVIYDSSCDVEYVNLSIGWISSSTLKDLNLFCHHPLTMKTLATLGQDLPGLERLSLFSYSSINGMNVVIQNHPKLKSLNWKNLPLPSPVPDLYFYPEGLQQKILEELVIEQRIDAHKDLPRLINNLTSLKNFRHRSWDNVIQGIVETRPDVKIQIA